MTAKVILTVVITLATLNATTQIGPNMYHQVLSGIARAQQSILMIQFLTGNSQYFIILVLDHQYQVSDQTRSDQIRPDQKVYAKNLANARPSKLWSYTLCDTLPEVANGTWYCHWHGRFQ
jgi:hypothetical protein